MKHKTSELTGALLDAAVALAEGWAPHLEPLEHWLARTGSYCTDWAAGGPIIEREHLWLYTDPTASRWIAGKGARSLEPGGDVSSMTGPSPLIAAMRAYVASKLGEEVELS